MRKKRTPIMLALAGLIASLITFVSSTAAHADTVNPQWYTAGIGGDREFTTSPAGTTTLGCAQFGESENDNLTTYNSSGTIVQELDRTEQIDGVNNCIAAPAVDKNGDVYGVPTGGPNLLAYSGNTLKWKYPVQCTGSDNRAAVVGADGNIYTLTQESDGVHLVGLTPNAAAGQAQPTKVLDVPIDSDCGYKLTATKNALVVQQKISGGVYRFFSYSGKYIRQSPSTTYDATTQDAVSAKFNDDGWMFSNVSMVGGNAIVARYPWREEQMWSYPLIPGTKMGSIHPVMGGGVVLAVDEPAMVSPGVPESPARTISKLVVINSAGQWVRDIELASFAGTGYGNWGRVAVDAEGHAAVLTPYTYRDSQNKLHSEVHARLVNTTNGVVSPTYVLADHYMEMEETHTIELINGMVVFKAACFENCNGVSGKRLYALQLDGIESSYPRSSVFETSQRPAAPYIALGDSFSAGEGVEPFEAGTDTPNLNKCHRSDYAYPRLISGSSAKIPSLGSNGFRACSGAVTENITDAPQWNEGSQLDLPVWPDNTTQLVTMTIGGNDIKFGDLGNACVTASCAIGSSAYNASLNEINNTLPGKLEATYKKILQQTPNAKVYVLGYPHVIANKSASDAFDSRCFYMHDSDNTTNPWADVQGARDIVTKLNAKIQQKVNDVRAMNAGNQRLVYVPLDGADSPFNGHEVCGTASSSWFHNVDQALNGLEFVFHPNKLGYEGYATVAGAAINAG